MPCACDRGYGTAYYLSTNGGELERHRRLARPQTRRAVRQPVFHADPSDLYSGVGRGPVQAHVDVESLRNDGRVWVPTRQDDTRHPNEIPDAERDYYLERKYPSFGNLVPRDVRVAQRQIDLRRGPRRRRQRPRGLLDFREAIQRLGRDTIAGRYGNLFEM
jgi:hypothetical protein